MNSTQKELLNAQRVELEAKIKLYNIMKGICIVSIVLTIITIIFPIVFLIIMAVLNSKKKTAEKELLELKVRLAE